jgi:O-antigen/teichoic acid export membrane protein
MAALPARFRRNTATLYLNTFAAAVIALVMTPVLAQGLGKHDFGIWVVVGSMILYLELLEFGFGTATIKYVAEFEALEDRDRLRSAITTSFWVLALPGLVALLIGLAAAALFPYFIDIRESSEGAARLLVVMLAANMAISIPGDTFGGALIGLQRYDLQNSTLAVIAIAQAVAWGIVIGSGGGLVALGVVTVALSLVGQLWRYMLVRRLVPGVTMARNQFDRRMFRGFARLSFWYALGEVADVIIFRVDTIVVGIVVNIQAAAVYAVGQKLALVAEKLIQPVVYTLFPHSSELAALDDREGLRSTLITGTRISMGLAGPLTVTLAVMGEPAVRAWVGPSFAAAGLVVVYLAAATAIKSLVQTGQTMLNGMGLARVPSMIVATEAGLNLLLSVVLGHAMGIHGVALGTFLASAATDLGLLLPYMCRRLGISIGSFLFPVIRAHLPGLLVSLGVGWLVVLAGPSGIAPVLAGGAAIGLSYLMVFYMTGLTARERAELTSKVRRKGRTGVDVGS